MTKQDLWNVLLGAGEPSDSLAGELDRTSFDDLLEINLRDITYRIVHHVSDKYSGIIREGDFQRLYTYAADHFVREDDREAYRDLINPDTLLERLNSASPRGILSGEFHMKGIDGSWIATKQILIAGPELDLPPWIVNCYVYDIRKQKQRVEGRSYFPKTGPAASDVLVVPDEVTGLLVGAYYFRAIQREMPSPESESCIINIFIENYKRFSDWYGIESGRYLLSEVSRVLREFGRKNNGIPGYVGQEEFVIVVPFDMKAIRGLHADLTDVITKVSLIEGFSPIFGIAMIDDTSTQILDFFNRASLTTEEIKGRGGTRIRMYSSEIHRKNTYEYKVLYHFQHAIEKNEISFNLQPQVHVSNRKIVGAESLARWNLPDGTSFSPAEFIPVLEKYRLVTRLDVFIWESVCKWLSKCLLKEIPVVPISVNVSQLDIEMLDVPEHFKALIEQYDLPANLLKIEITESACAENSTEVRDTVSKLRENGFAVLMDDFGSGYSSLNMLRSLNVDLIKLDAQFLRINKEDEKRKGINILESVVNMTKNLTTPIIVEGVEQEGQVEFLLGLGCRYMQGFFFYRPMPVEEFEKLICEPGIIEARGFRFKHNMQLQTREFLDENIYSDTMLNNMVGPVVFYNWHGNDVDIVRYNEQFYEMVGLDLAVFEERKIHIQDTLPEEDRQKLYDLLQTAVDHWAVGSKGIVRSYKPNGALVWLALKIYFLDEDAQGKKFYASAQDVTEMHIVNAEMPGAYFRCTLSDDLEFLFIGLNFQSMTGYTEKEIKQIYNNRLINMIHPNDREQVAEDCKRVIRLETEMIHPYRIRRKSGDYIYVADHSQISDRFGAPCWQSILLDITEIMENRNRMQVLSKYMASTICLLHRTDKGLVYEPVIHGLQDLLGMNAGEFADSVNSGEFCRMIRGYDNGPHAEATEKFVKAINDSEKKLIVDLPDGRTVYLAAHADETKNEENDIEYILGFRQAEGFD